MPYLLDGTEVEVVATVSSGVIIRRMFDGGEDAATGDPEIVARVFEEAPTERRAKVILDLEAKETTLRNRIADLAVQVRERERAENSVTVLSSLHPALTRLADFLAGRITHYLVIPSYDKLRIVEAVKGAIPQYDNKASMDVKLICLFGGSGGDLQWQVNRYSEGGGNWSTIEPFTCRGDAIARLQELIDNAFESEGDFRRNRLYNAAVEYGLQIPVALSDWVLNSKVDAMQSTLADLRGKVSAAEAELLRLSSPAETEEG